MQILERFGHFTLLMLAACGVIALSQSVYSRAQSAPPSPLKSFEDSEYLSFAPQGTPKIPYSWTCSGREREISFQVLGKIVENRDEHPRLDSEWKFDGFNIDGAAISANNEEIDGFLRQLDSIAYIVGRCFPEESELTIGGYRKIGHVFEQRIFRLP